MKDEARAMVGQKNKAFTKYREQSKRSPKLDYLVPEKGEL